MNHIYRLVWNRVRAIWVVASEIVPGRGKAGCPRARRRRPRWGWLAAIPLGLPLLAAAAPPHVSPILHGITAQRLVPPGSATPPVTPTTHPTGGQVVAGSGSITYGAHLTTIAQDSQALSLNWLTFNIGAQDTVNFVQPNRSAIAVNRIADPNGSTILGHLNANGQVFLINPNGVLFGEGAQVDVGGLVASTLDLDDRQLGGDTLRFEGDSAASVANQGTITVADGGFVALLGHQVSNQGVISVRLGTVALAGGNAVTLNFEGAGLAGVQVDRSALDALAENRQLIVADGGQVLMTAGAKDSLLASVVNNTGVIQARTVEHRDGRIILLGGMEAGTTTVAGTLDASAPTGGDGGFIETSAARVQVADDARITTRASDGATGTWRIDPQDYTIAATGGDMTGAALSTSLASTAVEIQSSAGGTAGSGDINVDDEVTWSADTVLTLTASNDVNINADLTATGDNAGLVLAPNTANGADAASGTGQYTLDNGASITLSGLAPSLSIAGTAYTIITSLGAPGSTTMTDLQGIKGGLAGHYALGADIDASATAGWNGGLGFDPIGDSSVKFTGIFDGLGHTIADLTIDRPSTDYVGLFGFTHASEIRNVGLLGGSIIGDAAVGGLVGFNQGPITQAYTTGTAAGSSFVGGLVGRHFDGAITQAHATGAVSGDSQVGGLVGGSDSGTLIAQAYASGAVSGTGRYVGGLVGNNDGTLIQVYATGAVSGSTGVGGLVGENYDTIAQAYATGAVSGSTNVGGLVGYNLGPLTQAYATGAVSGSSAVGGLVGNNFLDPVTDSYWDAETTGQDASSGSDASFGLTTVELEAALPTGFDAAVWGNADDHSTPYLKDNVGTAWIDSDATDTRYQLIFNVDQLQAIGSSNLAGHYALANDIDASATASWNGGAGFDPIGAPRPALDFRGVFDGLGHTITDLTIDRPLTPRVGLFGETDAGVIRNVGLLGGSVTGLDTVGALVGYNVNTTITQAYATGTVSGATNVGGLIGFSWGSTISQSYATGTVNGTDYVGGLVGTNDGISSALPGTITQSYATGTVSGDDRIGGLVGWNENAQSTITQAYATGAVNGNTNVGGLVGSNASGTITNGYWDTQTTGQDASSGSDASFGLTTAELEAALPTGFDAAVWGNADNHSTPYLKDNTGTVWIDSDPTDTRYSLIFDVGQLQAIDSGDLGGRYALANDIDASATATWNANGDGTFAGFDPIGDNFARFTGVFDGLGHTISDLTIDRPATDFVGLFGSAGADSVIRNLGLIGGSVRGQDFVGSLSGYLYATSSAHSATVTQAYATGTVSGTFFVGGLVGINFGTISQSHATGAVNGDDTVGGLVGKNGGLIDQAYATGAVSDGNTIGGLVGEDQFGTITHAHATGAVSGGIYVGGLVGHFINGTISQAYATGAVSGDDYVGGLLGFHFPGPGTISQTYATGAVSGTNHVGGLIGDNSGGTATDSYWDTQTTGQAASDGGTAQTTAQLQAGLPTGFVPADWGIVAGQSYAYFLSQFAPGATPQVVSGIVYNDGGTTGAGAGIEVPGLVYGIALTSVLTGGTVATGANGYYYYLLAPDTLDDSQVLTYVEADGAQPDGAALADNASDSVSGLDIFGDALHVVTASNALSTVQANLGIAAGLDPVAAPLVLGLEDLHLDASGDFALDSDLDRPAGSLVLGAAGDITATNTINVASFTLEGGNWSQLGATLPTFNATDFTLAGGSFLRALGGDGSTGTPYQLTDIYGVQGIDSAGMLGLDYTLANDIDASGTSGWNSGAGFDPIRGSPIITPFSGVFDGLGHTINDLFIDRPTVSYVGLFGYAQHSTIRNVGLLGGSVTGNTFVGGLVGGIDSSAITRVYATGAVSSVYGYSGGLVGTNSGTITNAYATGAVSGVVEIGGLVGFNTGTISNAYATGAVSGDHEIGGLVAFNTGTISQVYATGNVSGAYTVGALVGYNGSDGDVSNAYRDTDGQPSLQGIGVDSNGQTVYGLTTAELEAALPTGFDAAVWGNADDHSTPYLKDNVGTVWIDSDTTDTRYTLIFDVDQLQAIDSGDLAGHYALATDIDASATSGWNANGDGTFAGFDPIGDNATSFTGVLDGLGHTIADLSIDRPSTDYVGLFGYAGFASAIRSLGLLGGSMTGHDYVGGLVGLNFGTITQAYATGAISGAMGVGGLVGDNLGTIAQAYATGAVSSISVFQSVAGGLVGYNPGTITQAYATGAVSGTDIVGGLVGGVSPSGAITQSFATGTVSGDFEVGGLAGYNYGAITQAYATGAVSGSSNVGGLVGENFGTTTDSYWDTQTTGQVASDGGTGLTSAQMLDPASFAAWGTAISAAGGSSASWRIYEGHTAPLLRAFMADLVVTADDVVNTYDATAFAGSTDFSLGSVTPGFWHPSATADQGLLLGNTNTATAAIDAGSYALAGDGLYSSQLGYDIDFVAGTLTIDPAAVTITTNDVSKTYDGTTSAAGSLAVSSGTLFGTDSISGGSFAFDDKNAGTGKTVAVSGVTVSDGNGGDNYTVSYQANTGSTILQRAINAITGISASDKVYDGTTSATLDSSSAVFGNIVAGDSLGVATANGAFDDRNAGTDKTVEISGLGLGGADAGNYSLADTTASTTADVSPLGITVDATASDKVYDGSTAAMASLTTTGLISGDSVTFTGTGTFDDKNVGTGKMVTVTGISASGTDAGNYSFNSSDTDTADISQLGITVDATASNKIYDGSTAATASLAATGVIAGDDLAFASGSATFDDKNAGTDKVVTVTGISASGTDAGNYSFNSSDTDTADISRLGITVDATASDKVYDGSTAATASLAATGAIAGDDLAFASGSATFDDKNAGTNKIVTVSGIAASGADAGNYSYNATASTIADISKLSVTVGATGTDRIYDGTVADSVSLASAGILGADDISFTGSGAFADKNVGTDKAVAVTGIAASGTDAGNYSYNATAATTADISKLAVTVDATGSDRVYDRTVVDNVGLASAGILAGDTVSFAGTGAFADKNVGEDKAVSVTGIAASGTDAGNYSYNATASTTADITKLAVTVDATGTDRVYDGGTADNVSLASAGILAGDTVSFDGSGAFADKNVGEDKAVSVTGIAASGDDAGNYSYNATASTTADITKLGVTVDATGTDRVYDGTVADSVSLASTGILADDVVDFAGTGAFADKNVGEDKAVSVTGIAASGADAGNYSYNILADTTADITPATLTYVATPAAQYIGQSPSGLAGSVEGLVGGDSLADATDGDATWTTTADADSAAGRYAINGSGLSAGNYVFAQAPGNATALTLFVSSVPQQVDNALASLLWQLMHDMDDDDPLKNNSFATDVSIVDGGIRLP